MHLIREQVAEDFEAVDQLIIQELHSDVALVESIGHYIVESGGKRVRPLLALLMAQALGTISNAHREFSAVIEFIHTATLLHDDVVDVSTLRRGQPTANAQWGNAPSVLVGDFIYSRAFQLMVRMGHMPIMRLMSDTTNRIAEGEVLQLENAGNPDTTETAYYDVIERKTAALFQAATEGAARLAAADDPVIRCCSEFGYHLGMAFQLVDDALDYSGDAALMGKNVGDDLAEGKPTLPLIRLMQRGQAPDAAMVRNAIVQKSTRQLDAILNRLQASDALQYTRSAAQRHHDKALQALQQLPRTTAQQPLLELLNLTINRDH
jgi:octaprenyl-diphosphate synthase